ncbi:hypothetical protein [Aliikangiella coralliicola]|uniref:Uncharacterized protein n=1 Tax=Aliikangiella coralliicola TaxID=2592383 RepID=A0A545U7H9_9GAMM|nr:hypothetical protein [Aliikangiella coralliicola]TQV85425.1 hypothetical protein FLL46_19870 [Aliikangiella coralliicola]
MAKARPPIGSKAKKIITMAKPNKAGEVNKLYRYARTGQYGAVRINGTKYVIKPANDADCA